MEGKTIKIRQKQQTLAEKKHVTAMMKACCNRHRAGITPRDQLFERFIHKASNKTKSKAT